MKFFILCLALLAASGAEPRVDSPDGCLALVVSDDAGWRFAPGHGADRSKNFDRGTPVAVTLPLGAAPI